MLHKETPATVGKRPPFKPCIVYDRLMDSIRVITADCSVTEVSYDRQFVLLRRNDPKPRGPLYAGFSIEWAVEFSLRENLPITDKVSVSAILRKMALRSPAAAREIETVALPLLERHRIDKVEFPHFHFVHGQ